MKLSIQKANELSIKALKSIGFNQEEASVITENFIEGELTTDPEEAMEGGLLPIAEHKGSGLGFIIELLAGALTSSHVGYNVKGGWGSLFILINPTILRDLNEFKNDVTSAITELKSLPRAKGVDEIYYP